MKFRETMAVRKAALVQWGVSFGGAFWIRWGVCAVALLAALLTGGVSFFMIALGGALGCVCAVMLDAFEEFRTDGGGFQAANAGMGLLAFVMACAGFFISGGWGLVVGCLASSGLLLALLLRRLDRETGMNIQVGFWLGGVAAALLLLFLYTGPYAGWIGAAAFVLAVCLYAGLLATLRAGAENGLRAAWFLALGIGIAILSGAAIHALGVHPASSTAFGGFAVGLVTCSLFSPLRALTCWVACKLDEEKKPEW